jgi:ribosome recycling factor
VLYEFPDVMLLSKSIILKLEIIKFIIKFIEEGKINIKNIKHTKMNEFIKPLIKCLSETDSELKKHTESLLKLC